MIYWLLSSILTSEHVKLILEAWSFQWTARDGQGWLWRHFVWHQRGKERIFGRCGHALQTAGLGSLDQVEELSNSRISLVLRPRAGRAKKLWKKSLRQQVVNERHVFCKSYHKRRLAKLLFPLLASDSKTLRSGKPLQSLANFIPAKVVLLFNLTRVSQQVRSGSYFWHKRNPSHPWRSLQSLQWHELAELPLHKTEEYGKLIS